jgi:drug/metabolite transporter (DMT)-like permease
LAFAGMGLLNNLIPFTLIFWGQTAISSSLAAILNATTPVWTVLLAHFFTRDERLNGPKLIGVFLGLLGVAVTIGIATFQELGRNVAAQVAVLGAAISYAVAGIYGRRFRSTSPTAAAAGQLTTSAVMMLPVILIIDRPWQQPAPGLLVWGALLGLALLSTALAYIIYFHLLATIGATNLLLVTFLIPISAMLLGILILGERLLMRQLMGMGLIGLGLVSIDGRWQQWFRSRLRANDRYER